MTNLLFYLTIYCSYYYNTTLAMKFNLKHPSSGCRCQGEHCTHYRPFPLLSCYITLSLSFLSIPPSPLLLSPMNAVANGTSTGSRVESILVTTVPTGHTIGILLLPIPIYDTSRHLAIPLVNYHQG